MKARLNYLELPVDDIAPVKPFYSATFAWRFSEFGPNYVATTTGDTDIGFQADASERMIALLPVIEVDDLKACEAAVRAAEGTITRAIFAFRGGRRFHFRDPAGHELAAMQTGNEANAR